MTVNLHQAHLAECVRQFVEEHYTEDVPASCPDCTHPVEHCQCPPDFLDDPINLRAMTDGDLAAFHQWLMDDIAETADGSPESGPGAVPAPLADLLDEAREVILDRCRSRSMAASALAAQPTFLTLVSNGIGLVTIKTDRPLPERGDIIRHNGIEWVALAVDTDTPRYTDAFVTVERFNPRVER